MDDNAQGRGSEAVERTDPLSGERVRIVPSRQSRPNLPGGQCPFCPGGLEAPDPYQVLAFPNRWPPFDDGRAEVVLYTPRHDASFGSLSDDEAALVVDLWADRSASLGKVPDVAYVLIFENRGSAVGATIPHPHGQIYAFPGVPPAAARELEHADLAASFGMDAASDRLVDSGSGWRSWVPFAAKWPFELLIACTEQVRDLESLDPLGRRGLGRIISASVRRYDRLFGELMPYMLWVHQQPCDGRTWSNAWLHVHLAPIFRAPSTQRFVAAGELGSGVWFNPVDPTNAAERLREAG